MPQTSTCAKCGSTELLPSRVMDRINNSHIQEQDLNLRVDADPSAFLFAAAHRSSLHAIVCGRCGYVEFYATDPATLLDAWRRSKQTTE